MIIKSIHFKKTVARSSFLSKLSYLFRLCPIHIWVIFEILKVLFEKISVFYSDWPKSWIWQTLGQVRDIFCKCHLHNASKEVLWPKNSMQHVFKSAIWDHPFNTSACLRVGGGVSPCANGGGQKLWKFADVLMDGPFWQFFNSSKMARLNYGQNWQKRSKNYNAFFCFNRFVLDNIKPKWPL